MSTPSPTSHDEAGGAARTEPAAPTAAAPAPDGSARPAAPAGPPRPPGSARRTFSVAVLVSEVFVVLFASLVAHGLDLADRPVVWGVGVGAMAACTLAAGLLRHRAGYVLGSVVQVLLVAAGVVLPMMFVVGGIFAVLWVAGLTVGTRIDAERAERYRAEVDHHEAHR